MTVSTNITSVTLSGNDLATAFPFTFRMAGEGHLRVTLRDSSGVDTELATSAYTVDYTTDDDNRITGGTVNYPVSGDPLPTGSSLIIERVTPLTQKTDLTNQGTFFAEVHEDAFDRSTLQSQEASAEIARAIRVPVGESLDAIPTAANRASKFLAFNSEGNPVMSDGVASGEADIAQAVIDAEAAAAQTTLDAAATAADRIAVATDKALTEGFKNEAQTAANTAQSVAVSGYSATPGGPVAVATTGNVTLSGEQTIDGVLTSASRVLVKDQTAPAENGIYVTAAGAWSRASDMNAADEVEDTSVFVTGGTVNKDKTFVTDSAVTTLDTDAIDWVEARINDGVQDQIDLLDPVVPQSPVTAYHPAPVHQLISDPVNSNIAFGSDYFWSRTTGTGSFFDEFPLTAIQKTWSTIQVRVPATGTFSSNPNAQLFGSGAAIGSQVFGVYDTAAQEYVIDLPVSGSPDEVRVRWSTTSDGKAGWPYAIEGGAGLTRLDLTLQSSERVLDVWYEELFARSGNLFSQLPMIDAWSNVFGGAATIEADGRTVSLPSGSINSCSLPFHGMFGTSDNLAVLIRQHLPATTVRSISNGAGDWQNGNPGATDQKLFQDGAYYVSYTNATTGESEAMQLSSLRFDTRAIDEVPATAAKYEVIAAFNIPDETWVGRILANPERLMQKLAQWEQTDGFVDSAAEGDRVYATLAEAVRAGHKAIYCGETQRPPVGLAIAGQRKIHLQNGAAVRFAESLALSDFTATAADANVYYRASTQDPLAIFEVEGDVIRRMEATNPTGTNLYTATTSEAAVRATAGTAWHGNGSEGLGDYIRPFGDTGVGKTYERLLTETGLVTPEGSDVHIIQDQGVASGFAMRNGADVSGRLTLEGGTWGYIGETGNAIGPESASNAVTVLRNILVTEGGNDGYNSGSLTGYTQTLIMDNAKVDGNWSDGIAPGHGQGRDRVFMTGRCSANGNGKNGLVTIGLTDLSAAHFECRDNRSPDILYQHSRAGGDTINIASADIGELNLNLTGSAAATGRIVGIVDTITDADGVTVVRFATV